MTNDLRRVGVIAVCAVLFGVAGCPFVAPNGNGGNGDPAGFTSADGVRGGALYDKWWSVTGAAAPTDDHPLWAGRPDQDSNTRTGSDTWRCKECHGWDYQGVAGAYGSGSHRTGIAGVFGTTLTPQEVFHTIMVTHGFDDAGLADEDAWDLAKFILERVIDTDDLLDGSAFNGSVAAGMSLYDTACAACHGPDGLAVPPGADADHEDFVGLIANENPWEFQHKVRFGQPGSAMPAQDDLLALDEVSDLGAYAQYRYLTRRSDGVARMPPYGRRAARGRRRGALPYGRLVQLFRVPAGNARLPFDEEARSRS